MPSHRQRLDAILRILRDPVSFLRRRFLVRVARRAQESRDWETAVRRWHQLLATVEQPAPPWLLLRLGGALREAERYQEALEVFVEARVAYPNSMTFAMNFAEVHSRARRWDEALDTWLAVAEEFGEGVPVRVWTRAAQAALHSGSVETARDLLERAQVWAPNDPGPLEALARLEEREGDLERAVHFWSDLAELPSYVQTAAIYRRIAILQWRLGDLDAARRTLDTGRERFGDDQPLTRTAASLSMVLRDWPLAIDLWNVVLEAGGGSDPALPSQDPSHDWHEGTWLEFAEAVMVDDRLRQRVTGRLAVAVARNIGSLSPKRAVALLEAVPVGRHETAVVEYWRSRLLLEQLRDAPVGLVPVDARPQAVPAGGAALLDAVAEAMGAASDTRDGKQLSVLRVSVARRSGSELAFRSARVVTCQALLSWVRRTGESAGWDELEHGVHVIDAEARLLADEFGDRYGSELGVPEDALSDAMFLPLQQLLLTLRPVRRLADWLTETDRSTPVFIDYGSSKIRLFDPIDLASGWPLLLALELRRRGLSAALLTTHESGTSPRRSSPLAIDVAVRAFSARQPEQDPQYPTYRSAIVPAGIRSIDRVVSRLGDPLVYASDSIVNSFAYDRTVPSRVDYRPMAALFPDRALLRSASWPITSIRRWRGRSGSVEVDLGSSGLIDGDVLDLSRRLLGDFLSATMANVREEVDERGIVEAHVADHLYASSALFAGAVRERGGRVVLWPHSTNPVHTRVRRRGSFDVVYALTREGCRQWGEHHPEAEVRQASGLMLDWAARPAPVDYEHPLAVVVLGGKHTLGLTPFLPHRAHEAAVRETFLTLEELRRELGIRVLFKPKGGGEDGPVWLDQMLGGATEFSVVREHPMRIRQPNAVFVSVSLGSSALLEGITRGIPGLLVRQFPVVDYTTIQDGALPITDIKGMAEVVTRCVDPRERARFALAQVDELAHELGRGPSWRPQLVRATGEVLT